ncbi:MAG: hypothetical protein ACK44N_08855 [Bacteroidota bacterium]|jgi:hypothetical protein
MNIYLTFDYELYFGERTGTAKHCILNPTQLLKEVADKHQIKLVQFVDVGYIIKLEEYKSKYLELEEDYQLVTNQVKQLYLEGHDIQLHIHPHWEDSFYRDGKWHIIAKRYKLSDFDADNIERIVATYKQKLESLTAPDSIFAFRAGGWCIQPFEKFKSAFLKNNITVDSSVFRNGKYSSEQYSYDFTNAPNLSSWNFDNDPCKPKEGPFKEIPIGSIKNSPLFYWKLFLLGRINPYEHKPLGDGVPIAAPGMRKKLLTQFTQNTVSIDGYNAALLSKALRQHKGKNELVIIGHPKSLTRFGLKVLDRFISENKNKYQFTTFQKERNK